jgi:single-strand DNA-binding protein
MIYLNEAKVIGNVTKDPELKAMTNGGYVCNLSIATNRTWKNTAGEKVDEAEFHNAVAFGRIAETISKWVKKGDQIYVSGRLKTTSWEDKETGQKRYKTEIIVESFQFGSKKGSPERQNDTRTGENDKDDGTYTPTENDEATVNSGDIPF